MNPQVNRLMTIFTVWNVLRPFWIDAKELSIELADIAIDEMGALTIRLETISRAQIKLVEACLSTYCTPYVGIWIVEGFGVRISLRESCSSCSTHFGATSRKFQGSPLLQGNDSSSLQLQYALTLPSCCSLHRFLL